MAYSSHRSMLAVHPRGCGEYSLTIGAHSASAGSSPRMRGIRDESGWLEWYWRFIPADAGNTPTCRSGRKHEAVHPRGCGEYIETTRHAWGVQGSSPRMRGIPAGRQEHYAGERFIPADAGNTLVMTLAFGTPTVHPRGCGEYDAAASLPSAIIGSSPRMRGIHLFYSAAMRGDRFIPADAGNTLKMASSLLTWAVHPRGCGEYALNPN